MVPRRVLFVHHFPIVVGSAISLYHLIRCIDRDRYIPSLVLAQEGPVCELFRGLGIDVSVIPMPLAMETPPCPVLSRQKIKNLLAFRPVPEFARLLRSMQPDIVHLNDSPLQAAAATAYAAGIPIVWHLRGVIQRQDTSLVRRCMSARIVSLSNRFIGVTEDETEQFGPQPHGRTIYNSVDLESIYRHHGAGLAIRRELGSGEDEIIIGAPVHLTAAKGVFDFVEAAGMVARACGNRRVRFVIAGHVPSGGRRYALRKWTHNIIGPVRSLDRVINMALAEGIQDRMHVLGFRKDILNVMDALDIVVFPSRLGSVGRAAIEGSALSKPTVATLDRRSSDRGLVLHERTGLIAKPGCPHDLASSILRLVNDTSLRHKLGDQACVYARANFDALANAQKVQSVYEELLDETQHG